MAAVLFDSPEALNLQLKSHWRLEFMPRRIIDIEEWIDQLRASKIPGYE